MAGFDTISYLIKNNNLYILQFNSIYKLDNYIRRGDCNMTARRKTASRNKQETKAIVLNADLIREGNEIRKELKRLFFL